MYGSSATDGGSSDLTILSQNLAASNPCRQTTVERDDAHLRSIITSNAKCLNTSKQIIGRGLRSTSAGNGQLDQYSVIPISKVVNRYDSLTTVASASQKDVTQILKTFSDSNAYEDFMDSLVVTSDDFPSVPTMDQAKQKILQHLKASCSKHPVTTQALGGLDVLEEALSVPLIAQAAALSGDRDQVYDADDSDVE